MPQEFTSSSCGLRWTFKFYLEERKDYTKREGVEDIHDEFNCMNKKSRVRKVQGILEIKK